MTEREKFEAWYLERYGKKLTEDKILAGINADLEARLKVAEDALDYIKTVNISSARCGEVASEALNKIRGE